VQVGELLTPRQAAELATCVPLRSTLAQAVTIGTQTLVRMVHEACVQAAPLPSSPSEHTKAPVGPVQREGVYVSPVCSHVVWVVAPATTAPAALVHWPQEGETPGTVGSLTSWHAASGSQVWPVASHAARDDELPVATPAELVQVRGAHARPVAKVLMYAQPLSCTQGAHTHGQHRRETGGWTVVVHWVRFWRAGVVGRGGGGGSAHPLAAHAVVVVGSARRGVVDGRSVAWLGDDVARVGDLCHGVGIARRRGQCRGLRRVRGVERRALSGEHACVGAVLLELMRSQSGSALLLLVLLGHLAHVAVAECRLCSIAGSLLGVG
jgi:hypothetical protein